MHKIYSIFAYVFIFTTIIYSQAYSADYQKIDAHARNAPSKVANSVETLAEYLVKPASNDFEKVRSFYVWIAENIEYDVQSFLKGGFSNLEPDQVIQKKKAVCHGYASLFQALCTSQGIQSELIPGYSKGFGFSANNGFTQSDHAWNAVSLGNRWYVMDVTWGSGGINDKKKYVKEFKEEYFLPEPKEFIKNHMPQDPMWQLLPCPVSIKAFAQGNAAIEKELAACEKSTNFSKAIAAYHGLPSDKKELQAAKNAYAFNPENRLAMAQGFVNYAYALIKNVKQELKSKEEILEVIALQEESLQYLNQAADLLKNVKGSQGEAMKTLVNQNIRNAEQNLKAMKEVIKS